MRLAIFPGRFQPFHKEHLVRIKYILKNHERMVVFVFPTTRDVRNPYSLKERMSMIRLATRNLSNVAIISNFSLLDGVNCVIYTENPMLKKFFSNLGFEICSLPKRTIHSTYIRAKKSGWERLVPAPVLKYLLK